ncbi:MAG: methyltransferase domain-containing protein [Candidatus Aenigmarchaeota archaeon]|nr:methyltransferase domain-containing protein [Candidatus Aenigmarchaeota archaeon]
MILFILSILIIYLIISHHISYKIVKKKILNSKKWGLNICCGKTDGGGVNADVIRHDKIPNFVLVDVYNLPFKKSQFKNVLCSHTIEHVKYPKKLYNELKRVGKKVKVVIPPLYDIGAALNFFEHKWIFLSFRKEHRKLPNYIKLPFSSKIQNLFGQIRNA